LARRARFGDVGRSAARPREGVGTANGSEERPQVVGGDKSQMRAAWARRKAAGAADPTETQTDAAEPCQRRPRENQRGRKEALGKSGRPPRTARPYMDSSVKNEMIGRVIGRPLVECDEGSPSSHSCRTHGVSTSQGCAQRTAAGGRRALTRAERRAGRRLESAGVARLQTYLRPSVEDMPPGHHGIRARGNG
jgi:hypothetical protein